MTILCLLAMLAGTQGQAQVSDAAEPKREIPIRKIPSGGVRSVQPPPAEAAPQDDAEKYLRQHLASQISGKPEFQRFSINFPGGSPEALIHFLNEVAEPDPNVMIAPTMRGVTLPAFELKNVTLHDVFQALNTLTGASIGGAWQVSGSHEPIWVLNPAPKPRNLDMSDIVVPERRSANVSNIEYYLSWFTLDDITTSIQTAWGMLGGEMEGQLKFHKETNLLIAVGSKEQLNLVQEVLMALKQQIQQLPTKSMLQQLKPPARELGELKPTMRELGKDDSERQGSAEEPN